MNKIWWSHTRVDAANYCLMRYWLKYIEKAQPLRLSSYLKGDLLHKLIEHFWERLGKPEEVSRRGAVRYSNPEEFAEYAQRMWDRACIMAENSGRQVAWSFENERWAIRNGSENIRGLDEICSALFPILVEEGQPLHRELSFRFSVLNKLFRVKIDELRVRDGDLVLRDYKSGRPFMREMKLNLDPQLTTYGAAVTSMLRNEEVSRKLGLLRFREQFMDGNFLYVNPNLREEFFLVESPVKIEEQRRQGKNITAVTIHPTTRTDDHFLEVNKMIDVVQARVNTGLVVAERGRKCDYCDVKYACQKKLQEAGKDFMEDRKGQFCIDFVVPEFAKKPKKKEKPRRDPLQRHFSWRYDRQLSSQ